MVTSIMVGTMIVRAARSESKKRKGHEARRKDIGLHFVRYLVVQLFGNDAIGSLLSWMEYRWPAPNGVFVTLMMVTRVSCPLIVSCW